MLTSFLVVSWRVLLGRSSCLWDSAIRKLSVHRYQRGSRVDCAIHLQCCSMQDRVAI